MNINRKLIAMVLSVAFTLTLLASCGKNGPPVSDDPNIGVWKATKVEMFGEESDANEVFENGFELELMENGKCELRGDNGKDTYQWKAQGNAIAVSIDGTDFMTATINDGVMVIDDFMETGMKITLEKEGAVSGVSKAKEAGYYVIDSMTIDGELYDAKALEDAGINYYIRLKEDNTAEIRTDTLIKGTWKDGEIRYQQNGEDLVNKYVLTDDILTIEIADGDSQATLVFKRSSESAAQAAWNGSWYGYIWVTRGFGSFEDDGEDPFVDAYLTIGIDETGSGTLKIILDGDDENLVEASIKADENHFEVTEGFFGDIKLNPSEWWVALSPNSEGEKFVVSGTYTDPEDGGENGFEYMFSFRPLGELWEQEEREGDRLPPGYDAYKSEQNSGGGTADFHTDSGEPTDEVTSVASHFTSAQLKDINKKLSQAYNSSLLRNLKYEEVRDKYFGGADGTLDYDGDILAIYRWFATDDGEAYVQVSFQDYGDGYKTAGGIGSYLP